MVNLADFPLEKIVTRGEEIPADLPFAPVPGWQAKLVTWEAARL